MSSRFDKKKQKKYIKKNVVPFKVKNNSNISDVKTTDITQTATVKKEGNWTTVVASAVLIM